MLVETKIKRGTRLEVLDRVLRDAATKAALAKRELVF